MSTRRLAESVEGLYSSSSSGWRFMAKKGQPIAVVKGLI